MKVCVAVPCLEYMASDFALSLAAMFMRRAYDRKMSKVVDLALVHQQGSIIMEARNALVAKAQAINATHIFFLDSDVVVPPDTLDRLIAWHKPIVCASYVKRVEPHPLLGEPDGPINGAPLQPMLSVPLGCALISMKVFADLKLPYFRYITTEAGSISEDTYFSLRVREAGFTIHLDTQLTKEIGHVGSKVYRP